METSKITVKQLSELSGYSVSTVSKALNDKNDISKSTIRDIKAIAKKFNYVPNKYAIAFRANKAKTIAVVLPNITEFHFNHALCYLQQCAEDCGHRVLFYQTFNSTENAQNYIYGLNDGTIDGVFVINDKLGRLSENHSTRLPLFNVLLNENQSIKDIKQLVEHNFFKFLKIRA